ncbi:flavin reductase family protein [Bradyrhizobium sp. CB1650]|uniref:flavin reductase family protein n=1 Tax=Bradyrhizobium sp. CB1650 TaxID=3039153 RepID=UPI0024358071|nr:flavin reductase family protein [Bradyrhizobium sp. CB1650]WGD53099.1 flavin reductase family protein [Bradyrhizobium sp. CB1650]
MINTNRLERSVSKQAALWDLASGPRPDAFRTAMRRVVGGVAVVGTLRDERPWGMTVSAYTPVCMEPPTLLVCVNAKTATAADIERERKFSLNLLSEAQAELSQRCAQPGASKYLEGDIVPPDELPVPSFTPVLREAIATFDCDASEIQRIGTHVVVIGAIRTILAPMLLRPLLYGQGRYLKTIALDLGSAGASA